MSDNPEYRNRLLTSALAGALESKRAKGLWFVDKDVYLDGYTFEECRFDNCKLHVTNAENVNFISCYVDGESYFVFGRSALSAIKLFNYRTEWYYVNAPHLVPIKDEKGRITLTNSDLSDVFSRWGLSDAKK